MKVNKVDVLLLQETHATDNTSTDFWTQQWGGQALWAPSNTPHSGGTAILVNRQVSGKLTRRKKAPDGSWARADLETEEGTFTLISAYSPADAAKRGDWIQSSLRQAMTNLDHPTITGGDWNCVAHKGLDSSNPYPGLLQGSKLLEDLMASHGLDDVLRVSHPDHRWYTRWEGSHGNRLDRIYATGALCENTQHFAPVMCPWSDHYMVTCLFQAPNARWKRPWPITAEPTYSHPEMNTEMENWEKNWGIDSPKADLTNPDWFDRGLEALQRVYKRVACRLGHRRRRTSQILANKLSSLESKLSKMKAPSEQLMLQAAALRSAAKADTLFRAQGAAVRSRLRGIQWKDETPASLSRLEKARGRSRQWPLDPEMANEDFQKRLEEYYKELFDSASPPTMDESILEKVAPLSQNDRDWLDRPLEVEEVSRALKGMNPHSSPGPDGLTAGFWQTFSQALCPWITEMGNCIGQTRTMPTSTTRGLVRLIYKGKGDPQDPSNYRPISLLPVHYKVCTKVWAQRWRFLLPRILHPRQAGFTPGRQGTRHIRLVQDMWDLYDSEGHEGAWLFLDFQKAYDRVQWPWLKAVVNRLQTGPTFEAWVESMYPDPENNNITRQLILPSAWSHPIQLSRGVAQGCPLSPILFNITVDPWLRAMDADPHWEGLRVTKHESVKVLAFADDTVLGLASSQDLIRALDWLERFQKTAGAQINWNKSTLWGLGPWRHSPPPWDLPDDLTWLGEPVKYLGILLGPEEAKAEQWGQAVEKVRSRARGWASLGLSLWTRARVMNTHLLPLIWYLAMNTPVTPVALRSLISIQSHFVWRGKAGDFERPAPGWIARDAARRKVADGGLGLTNIEAQCKSLLAKWIIDLLHIPFEIWAQIPSVAIRKTAAQWDLGMRVLTSTATPVLRHLAKRIGMKLPFWGAVVRAWIATAKTLYRPNSDLSTEEALCEPLAQAELGCQGFPKYNKGLKKGQWSKLGDLWCDETQQPWTDDRARQEGWLRGAARLHLETRWLHFPFEWRAWVSNPNPAPFKTGEWVAELSWTNGDPFITRTGFTLRNEFQMETMVRWHAWQPYPRGKGLFISRAIPLEPGEWWNTDTLVRLAVWQPAKVTDNFWSPGLEEDTPLNLRKWAIRRQKKGKGIPLLKVRGRTCYRQTGKWAWPTSWAAWKKYRNPVLRSRRRWQQWQRQLARPLDGDVRPSHIRELVLKYTWLGTNPIRMCQATTCPSCGATERWIDHGIWLCPEAKHFWQQVVNIFRTWLNRPVEQLTSYMEAALGAIQIDNVEWPELTVWFAIHGAALKAKHNAWCKAAHEQPANPHETWGAFRHHLAQMTMTAFEASKEKDDLNAFWTTWGKGAVLARPSPTGSAEDLWGIDWLQRVPVDWDPG